MSGFTPGEWVVSSSLLVCTREAQVVANCIPSGIPELDLPAVECVANARLIASSPRLYEYVLARSRDGDAEAAAIIAEIGNA